MAPHGGGVRAALAVVAALLVLTACAAPPGHDDAGVGASEAATTDAHAVRFVDVAPRLGIDLVTSSGNLKKDHIVESIGSGVAVADYDLDGDLDIYVVTAQHTDVWLAGSGLKANALYRNEGDGTFTEVAESAGVALRAWSTGAYFVDIDNDGDRDLFVTCYGRNRLFRNEGDGTFVDVTESSGLGGEGFNTSAAFGDLDGDGFLDVYVAAYSDYDLRNPPFAGARTMWKNINVPMGPVGLPGAADRLYRNQGDGTFRDVTSEAGIDDFSDPYYGLGVVMSDFDDDGDLDIYVANDLKPNYLWRNDGGMRFTDVGSFAGVSTNADATIQAGMGTDAGDFDGDGRIDLVVTNFSHDFNTLYRNEGGMVFADETYRAKLQDSYAHLVWGVKFLDYDNDGWLDMFTANGHVYPEVDDHPHLNSAYAQRNSLYRNRGDGSFENVTERAGPGLGIVRCSRGVAAVDLDLDGDIDLIVTNMEAPPNVLINVGGNAAGWLTLRLVGTAGSPRDAIGARVTLTAGGFKQVREVNPFGSYLSQSDYAVHFGLGDAASVEQLEVRWPSGAVEHYDSIAPRTIVTLEQGRGVVAVEQPRPGIEP